MFTQDLIHCDKELMKEVRYVTKMIDEDLVIQSLTPLYSKANSNPNLPQQLHRQGSLCTRRKEDVLFLLALFQQRNLHFDQK